MNESLRGRVAVVVVFLGIVTVLSGFVWRTAYVQGLNQLAARGQADLALAGDRLVGQLRRYREMSVLMADHPTIRAALRDGEGAEITELLLDVADKTAALDVLVLGVDGSVAASTSERAPVDLEEFSHVKRALRGALGWGHGPAPPLTKRAFFHASPVFDDAGKVQGAVLVITDLNGIDYNWRGTNPATFFTDLSGEVYIANRSELLFWQRPENSPGLIPPEGPPRAFSSEMIGVHEIWKLGWGPYLPETALHLTQELPVIGMTGEVLLDVSQTRTLAMSQAAAVAALCLAFGSLLYVAAERRRSLAAANVQLEARVAKRTEALRRAQDDLVQAGKLSALGQMSAGISHELNQPLMAIRSFADNAVQFIERDSPERAGDNLTRISEMTQRMGRIIQNLRAFARQETIPEGAVELSKVVQSALDLTRAHREDAEVVLAYDAPEQEVWVRGGEVRLGQVFVNLITNAIDAMSGTPAKTLRVSIKTGDVIDVSICDTGPGIEMPDKVFDPFYTTKQVGETGGMGLGLSISYGIVQSFGGQIRGANAEGGGAVFTVTLERAHRKTEAA